MCVCVCSKAEGSVIKGDVGGGKVWSRVVGVYVCIWPW